MLRLPSGRPKLAASVRPVKSRPWRLQLPAANVCGCLHELWHCCDVTWLFKSGLTRYTTAFPQITFSPWKARLISRHCQLKQPKGCWQTLEAAYQPKKRCTLIREPNQAPGWTPLHLVGSSRCWGIDCSQHCWRDQQAKRSQPESRWVLTRIESSLLLKTCWHVCEEVMNSRALATVAVYSAPTQSSVYSSMTEQPNLCIAA